MAVLLSALLELARELLRDKQEVRTRYVRGLYEEVVRHVRGLNCQGLIVDHLAKLRWEVKEGEDVLGRFGRHGASSGWHSSPILR